MIFQQWKSVLITAGKQKKGAGEGVQGEVYIHTYSFSGETEVACDLGFEYAVLPQVGVTAICCLCNLRRKKKREKKHAGGGIKLMYVCHEHVAFASSLAY